MSDEAPLPLFVLGTVLFPGMVLPLRVFEPRYRLLVERAMAGERRFGVVMADEDSGELATVGTVYELGACESLEQGHYLIAGVGGRRFRIQEELPGEAYRQARVRYLPQDDPDRILTPEANRELKALLDRYVLGLGALHHWKVRLPQGELAVGEWAFVLGAALQVELAQKQALLELDPAEARLELAQTWLQAEVERLEAFLAQAQERGDFFFRGNRFSKN